MISKLINTIKNTNNIYLENSGGNIFIKIILKDLSLTPNSIQNILNMLDGSYSYTFGKHRSIIIKTNLEKLLMLNNLQNKHIKKEIFKIKTISLNAFDDYNQSLILMPNFKKILSTDIYLLNSENCKNNALKLSDYVDQKLSLENYPEFKVSDYHLNIKQGHISFKTNQIENLCLEIKKFNFIKNILVWGLIEHNEKGLYVIN